VTNRIVLDPAAEADLERLYAYIAEQSGNVIAERYLRRIFAQFETLTIFPEIGSSRPDLRPGIRLIGFERRAVIAFAVGRGAVTILRVLYGGRDLTTLNEGE
jgi:toxin ParE1/3/4